MESFFFLASVHLQLIQSLDQLTGGQSVVLDEGQNVVLSCDQESDQCSISNFNYVPSFQSRDAETPLELKGIQARRFIQNLRHPGAALSEFTIRLGYSKNNGMDVLSCEQDLSHPENARCEIISYYCYFAGC